MATNQAGSLFFFLLILAISFIAVSFFRLFGPKIGVCIECDCAVLLAGSWDHSGKFSCPKKVGSSGETFPAEQVEKRA